MYSIACTVDRHCQITSKLCLNIGMNNKLLWRQQKVKFLFYISLLSVADGLSVYGQHGDLYMKWSISKQDEIKRVEFSHVYFVVSNDVKFFVNDFTKSAQTNLRVWVQTKAWFRCWLGWRHWKFLLFISR